MVTVRRLLVPWAVLLLALQLAGASHVIHRSLEAVAAPPLVPASIVRPLLRTGYHFQPAMNWINDPNAPMYYKGWYHLFYQYNPNDTVWGNIVWAHSVSRDLINWIALEPVPSDKYGCWSGSVTILRQVIAFPKNTSDPLLREWEKPAAYNPVATPVGGINATQFRDPTTAWYADGHWQMLIGGARGVRGLAYVYRSRDFRHCTRSKHPLHSALTGMWECLDFFPVSASGLQDGLDTSEPGAKYVLKNSLDLIRYDYYTIGSYNKSTDRRSQGKSGSTPTESSCCSGPIEEVEKLRGKPVNVGAKLVKPGEHFEVTGIATYQADVEVSFELDSSSLEKAEAFDPAYDNDAQKLCGVKGGVGPFGLWVLASADLQEKTAVSFRVFRDGYGKPKVLMCSDPTKSSLSSELYKPTFAGFLDTDISNGKIALRSLIDRSVVESFGAGGRTCILSRVYPSVAIGKDAHLYVFNNGDVDIKVSSLTVWEMKTPLMNDEAY